MPKGTRFDAGEAYVGMLALRSVPDAWNFRVTPRRPAPLILLTLVWLVGLLLSGWRPFDRATWWMEIAPVMIALPVLWMTAARTRITYIALLLIGLHGLILMIGGAYSYARVPIGFRMQDWLELDRNPYDRFGHIMQGFVPAIVFRELLIRTRSVRGPQVVTGLVIACCLAISAGYELIEFAAAMLLGQDAEAFLGTQGDPWDTQWDMLMCLVGALSAVLLLARWHDRQIAALDGSDCLLNA